MITAMIKEMQLVSADDKNIESVYFGGGTPSQLPAKDLNLLLNAFHENFKVVNDAEITIEVNPDDLSLDYANMLKSSGINRLSMGIQSFDDKILQWMNRAHNANQAVMALKNAESAGFENITADLIYGIPNTDSSYWKSQIEKLTSFGIPHISAYCLTFEPNTVFGKKKLQGKIIDIPDESALEQFQILQSELNRKGYEQYEISNFSKPGFLSKHNSSYWFGKSYFGIGPSAHSFNQIERRWNISNNSQYIKLLEQGDLWFESETLTTENRFNEYIMTRLRTKWGIVEAELRQISDSFFAEIQPILRSNLEKGNLKKTEGGYVLTDKAKFVADAVAVDLFIVPV